MKCNAPKTNGMPCQRDTAPGMTRCNLHGGANPAAKIKSEQMLAQARLPACEVLYDIIDRFQAATCAACGHPSGDVDEIKAVTRAAQVILDRTGMGPRATLEVTRQSDGDFDFDLLLDDEVAQLDYLLGAIKQLKAKIHDRLNGIAHPTLAVLGSAPDVLSGEILAP